MPFLYLILSFSLFLFHMMAALFISGYMDIQAVLESLRALFNLLTSLRALTLNFLTKTHSICVQSTRMGKMHQENKKILMLGKIWVLPLFFSFLVHHASSAREEATEASKRLQKTIMLRRTR